MQISWCIEISETNGWKNLELSIYKEILRSAHYIIVVSTTVVVFLEEKSIGENKHYRAFILF